MTARVRHPARRRSNRSTTVTSSGGDTIVDSTSGPDSFFSQVVLQIDFEGADGATSADDASLVDNTLTFNDNAQIDTDQFKFGASSLLLDGTDDYVTIPDNIAFAVGDQDYTVEAFIRFSSLASNQTIMSHWNFPTSNTSWVWSWRTTNEMRLDLSTNGTGITSTMSRSWTPVVGVWYHVAIVRDGSFFRMFVDGVQLGTAFNFGSSALFNSNNVVIIGTADFGGGRIQELNGHIDELRWTVGVARYTSTFNPPQQSFSSQSNVITFGNDSFESRYKGVKHTFENEVVFEDNISAFNIKRGVGTPEAAVIGQVGDIFLRTDGGAGTTLYVKESGTGNTGWVAK